ncbi:MAG: hypothetical protein MUF84_11220 [Anaerolineae bacterium]|jgi:hypothetical protein|nr:hypothetical protein [Anaerolineae bacterium]
MQVISNAAHISSRRKIGERAPFVGLVILAVSAVLVFLKPEWLWATMALVWLGFMVSLAGSYLGDRYVGPNAGHKRIPEALKGLDSGYTLLMYRTSVPFVLLEPGGLTVLSLKSQGGSITFANGKWQQRQKMSLLRRFAGQESLGRPQQIAESERQSVLDQLKKLLPDGVQVPVRTVLVFTNPDVVLRVDEDTVPVPSVRAAELKRWLRRTPMRPQLPDSAHRAIRDALNLGGEVSSTAE